MLQQVTAEVPPRLTAQVISAVRLDRTRMVNITFSHQFFCSWYMTKHISHTCGRSSCRSARYWSSNTHSHTTSKRCLATALRVSSSVTTTGHYVLNKDVDPQRLSSENNAMKEAQQGHTSWHRWYCRSSTFSSKLCFFSWTAYFAFVGDPSYSLVPDWRA